VVDVEKYESGCGDLADLPGAERFTVSLSR